MSRITTLLALILFSASAIFGQAVAVGSVSGTVSDSSGSSVPGWRSLRPVSCCWKALPARR